MAAMAVLEEREGEGEDEEGEEGGEAGLGEGAGALMLELMWIVTGLAVLGRGTSGGRLGWRGVMGTGSRRKVRGEEGMVSAQLYLWRGWRRKETGGRGVV